MKILGLFLISMGLFVSGMGVLIFPFEEEMYSFLVIGIPLLVGGVFSWRYKTGKRIAMAENILRAAMQLVIGIPVIAFVLSIIPTFIGSFFLPPGDSEWIMYGVVTIAIPLLIWAWWLNTKLIFSKSYRNTSFSEKHIMDFYALLPALEKIEALRGVKTENRREGTTKAQLRSATVHTGHAFLLILLIGLTKIPLLGIAFIPLKNAFLSKSGHTLDKLSRDVMCLQAPTLNELIAVDPRKHVLLLRSFLDDHLTLQSQVVENKNTDEITFEELICREAAEWGPIVAIGDPKEKMPQLGAARAYYTNETWQERALDLLETSRLIIMIMGKTPSVGWELERILEKRYYHKTMIIFPPADAEGHEQRWNQFHKTLHKMTGMGFNPILEQGHCLVAIAFNNDGIPLPISSPHQVSLVYIDALNLASKVIRANEIA